MKIKALILCLLANNSVFATEIYNPQRVLVGGEREFTIAQKWLQQEREYEGSTKILDERDYSSWATNIGVGFGIWRGFSLKLDTEVAYDGVLRKTFDPSLGFTNQKIRYSGLRWLGLNLQYYSVKKNLVFEVYGKTYLFNGRERNASLGGSDAGFGLKYLHSLDFLTLHGRLFTEVNGKKRTFRVDGEREIVDPYTKVGNELNLRYDFSRFWVSLGGHFLLATDLVTRSPSYNRSSDKGFGVGGILEFGYQNKTWGIRTWHKRSSEVFNVIPEESSEQREFEIEDQNSGVELTWRW